MTITDKDLGEIRLVKNERARRIIVRRKDDYFQLTYPPTVSMSYIEKTIKEMKPRLIPLFEKKSNRIWFSPDTILETYSFRLKITVGTLTNGYYMNLKDGLLSISCPAGTDYDAPSVQIIIKEFIEKGFRYEANRLFPVKMKALADKFGFKFTNVKINKSRTHWGSCSSKKTINLSYFCMLLPEYLIDFVILHELCHTIEMNHSQHFWLLLDQVTNNKAKELTKEMKSYKTAL
jgi:predicted metal-dependent hydrolase